MTPSEVLNEADIQPAPRLPESAIKTIPWESDLPHPPRNKWEQEYQAFLRLRPALLADHRDKYVAIHEGKVVEIGDDAVSVALRTYARLGHVPIYVDQVTERRRVERIPSLGRNRS